MTTYSPLRMASSEFGRLSLTLEPQSETFPTEPVLGIPFTKSKETKALDYWKKVS